MFIMFLILIMVTMFKVFILFIMFIILQMGILFMLFISFIMFMFVDGRVIYRANTRQLDMAQSGQA